MKNTSFRASLRTLLFTALSVGFCASAFAQTDVDALRYAQPIGGSTARSLSMGGTMGAAGTDFSAVTTNPAGLATFRQIELSFTPELYVPAANATFAKITTSNSTTKFDVSHVALVVPALMKRGKWNSVVFGIGYNRLANYARENYFTGTSNGSFSQYFAANSQGTSIANLDQFNENLAYQAYLTDTTTNGTSYTTGIANPATTAIKKSQSISTRGAMDEINIGLAALYNNRLGIGASLNFPLLHYTEDKTYTETGNATTGDFVEAKFRQYFTTNGAGVNGRLGLTYRLSDVIRVGLAVHTPSLLTLTDTFYNTMTSKIHAASYQYDSPTGVSKYTYTSPARLVGSISFIKKSLFGKGNIDGLLNVEGEYLDYGSARYALDGGSKDYEIAVNNAIAKKYGTGINLRVGGELAADVFRFRAGYAYFSDPFKSGISPISGARQQISAGIGLRERKIALDLTYSRLTSTEQYVPFASGLPTQTVVSNDFADAHIALSVAFKF